jgi:peptidyl-prolyl cis-trans isomerase B (cyclophilin B)
VAGNRDRQRRLARDKHRRQQELRRARQQQVRKRSGIALAALLAVGLILGLTFAFIPSGKSTKTTASAKDKATPTPTPTATSSASTAATAVAEPAHHCTYTASTTDVAKKESLPPSTPDYQASYTATITTNLGPIKFSLLNSKATCTVNSFVHLAQAGYFNNTQCHRLTGTAQGIYVLQCGDAYATGSSALTCSSTSKVGTGGPGYEFASENLTGAKYTAGTVAMANNGTADSNGSQFFIVYKNTSLGADYTPFATVSSGLNIVQNVAKAGTSCQVTEDGQSMGGPPKDKVIIDSVSIQST